MNKISKVMIWGATILSLISVAAIVYMYKSQPKLAFVRVAYLYDNFEYKKELETKLDNVMQARKALLDSLAFQLNITSRNIQENKIKDKNEIEKFNDDKDKYLLKKEQFEEDNQDATKRYTDEITKQLDQYVQDYGKANGYTYILGAEGSGAIMSADDKNDITNSVLDYVNERFKGKK